MRRMTAFASACVLIAAGVVSSAQQGPTLQSALAALGATGIRTLQFTATGRAYVLGQPPTAAEPWPVRPIKTYQWTWATTRWSSKRPRTRRGRHW